MGAVPRRNDVMSRIERLERLVQDLLSPDMTAPEAAARMSASGPRPGLYVENGEVVYDIKNGEIVPETEPG